LEFEWDQSEAGLISDGILHELKDVGGFTDAQVIAGLAQAIIDLAQDQDSDVEDLIIDSVMGFLDQGGIYSESEIGEKNS